MRVSISISVLAVLLAFSPADAQRGLDKDPCKDEAKVLDCLNVVLERVRKETQGKDVTANLLQKATPSSDPGSASVITDLVSPFIGALGFSGVSESDDGDTINLRFNTQRRGPFRISYGAEVKEGEVFKPLLASFPKKEQDAKKKELLKEVGDFDNTNFVLKIALERGGFGRNPADYTEMFSAFFDEAFLQAEKGRDSPEAALADIIDEAYSFDTHYARIEATAKASVDVDSGIQGRLAEAGYARIASLVSNQPQLILTVGALQRDGAAGPDELSTELRYEHGFVNVNSLVSSCPSADADSRPSLQCLKEYLHGKSKAALNAQRLSFALKYTDTDAFSFPLSDDENFTLDASRKWTGEASYGRVVRFDSNDKDQARFDLKAEYQDVEGDPKLQSRFVATATYTEKLPGNFTASLSAVWANKPEYRGEVDEEVSARFGLKWSVAKPKKDDKK